MAATWMTALLLLAAEDGVITLEPRSAGGCTAEVVVRLADPPAVPVTLTVTVAGPQTLEVEGVHLADAVGGWDAVLQPPEMSGTAQRTWRQNVRLLVKKPGAWPLPTVSVRFRASAQTAWERAEWRDILGKTRPGPEPEPLPPLPESGGRLGWAVAAASVAGVLLLLLLVQRWRRRKAPPLNPRLQALRDLAALPADVDSLAFHDHLAQILRAFLAGRFGLAAATRSTAELLDAVAALPDFPAEQRDRLRDLLERCDAVRFSGRDSGPEAARMLRDGARQFLEQMTP